MGKSVEQYVLDFSEKGLDKLNKQISFLKNRIDGLNKRYGAKHPDVQKGVDQLASVHAKKEGMYKKIAQTSKRLEKDKQKFTNDIRKADIAGQKKVQKQKVDSIRKVQKASGLLARDQLQSGLSLMFFGMAVRRFFVGIARTGFTTFTKLTANTEMANNAMNKLGAGLEAVKFALGSAFNDVIEVMLPKLMPLLDSIINFIDKHPTFTTWAIIGGVVLSTIIMIVGQLGLFINGLYKLKIPGAFSAGLKSIKWAFFKMKGRLKAIGSLIADTFGSKSSGKVRAFGSSLSGVIKKTLILIGKWLLLGAIFIGIAGLLAGDKTITGWVKTGVIYLAKLIAYIMYGIEKIWTTARTMGQMLKLMWDATIGNMGKMMVNVLVGALNELIDVYNSSAGKMLGKIGHISYEAQILNESDILNRKKVLQENLSSFYNGERLAEWMSSAENVGEMFDTGMKTITDSYGATTAGEARPDYLGKLLGTAIDQQEAGLDQLAAAEKNKESADIMKEASDNMSQIDLTGWTFQAPS